MTTNANVTTGKLPVGSKVRICATGATGTVQGHYAPLLPGADSRILVDRPHGHAGQATLRQSFTAAELELIE